MFGLEDGAVVGVQMVVGGLSGTDACGYDYGRRKTAGWLTETEGIIHYMRKPDTKP